MIDIKYQVRVFVKFPRNQLAIRVRWENKKRETAFLPGEIVDPAKWDSDTHKAKRNTTHRNGDRTFTSAEINATIDLYEEEIRLAFIEFGTENRVPTELELKKLVNERVGRTENSCGATQLVQRKSIPELLEEFLKEGRLEKNWNDINEEKYRQAVDQLLKACPGLRCEYITVDTMHKLKAWFIKEKYRNRTVIKQFTMLLSFLRWVNEQDGYRIPSKVLNYSTHLKVIKKSVRFINYEELVAFEKFPLSKPYLCHVRDLWCFMAYTSLRYSDLKNLKTGHIQNGRISLITEKTDDRISIPLCDGALRILEKYKDKGMQDGHVFDVPSNQKMNDYIKEAAKEAGLDRPFIDTYYIGTEKCETQNPLYEVISCHDARRTFVSVSLAIKIPHEVVMKATGHSSYKTMQPYIETASETQDIEMEKWNSNQYRSDIISSLDRLSEADLKKVQEFIKKIS